MPDKKLTYEQKMRKAIEYYRNRPQATKLDVCIMTGVDMAFLNKYWKTITGEKRNDRK